MIPELGRYLGEGIGYLPTLVFLGCPCGSAGKESACNVGDLGLIPELGRSPGEGKGYLILYSPWVHKELDATEPLALPCKYIFALILEALVISILRVSPRAICTLK